MQKHYAGELNHLKETLLRMGGLAEKMTHLAVHGLVGRTREPLLEVTELENQVNQLHIDIDEIALELIARRQPTATDLRFITAAMKINTDLERIGDQAINITEQAEILLEVPPVKPLIDIPRMAEIAEEMLKAALDAFVREDDDLAYRTILRDDQVDHLKDQIFRELLTFMMGEVSTIPRAMQLILVSRNLERVADHATNICEDVIFMVKGKDVRHQGLLR
jgi:phosphate transport system protein